MVRKRINVTLPEETIDLMDRILAKGDRSEFIREAVEEYVKRQGRANLRKRMKEGAEDEAELDLQVAEEWFDLDEGACPNPKK